MKIKEAYLTEYNTGASVNIDIDFAKYLKKGDVIYVWDLDEERESISFADSDKFYKLLLPETEIIRFQYEYVVYERAISSQGTEGVALELCIIDRCYSDSDEDGVLEAHGL